MHFQFLIEDISTEKLIGILMTKIQQNDIDITFDCKSFKGIGGFTKKNTIKETKTGKLLNDLATYLRGFNKSLQNISAAVFVVLDNDDNDPEQFKSELELVAIQNGICVDHVFCLAVEEMEAWLLGDHNAIASAYPHYKSQALTDYQQDSICGTWETLADVVYPGGCIKLKKSCTTYMELGAVKCEWAERIGEHMTIESNVSPSFNYFITEVQNRITAA